MKNDLLKGNISKVLVSFTLPFLISSFLQTFYGLADIYIIGRFEEAASLSAVSIGSQFMHMVTVIIIGISMGTTVCIGQAMGSNNKKEVSCIIKNTIMIFLLVAISMAAVLCINTSNVTCIMSTPIEAVEYTKDYLFVCFIGIPFIVAYNVISSIYRGLGDSKTPMVFIGIACIINIIFDYYLIGILTLGAKGAAFATMFAQAISSILAIIFLVKKEPDLLLQAKEMRINKSTIKKILYVGLPIALQDGFIQISFLIITIIANSRGLIAATSVGVVEKIISFLFLVPSALLSSLSALVAHNVGAKENKRAELFLKYGIMICVVYGVICMSICQLFPTPILGMFTKENDVIVAGVQYLRPYSFDCIFAGIHFCFSGYFCGYGYSKISFIHNLISVVFVRIPVAYFASLLFANTLLPMGMAAPLGSLVSVVICVGYYMKMKKNRMEVML